MNKKIRRRRNTMTTPPRKCPICGIDMEPCDYSPLYGYSWVHPKTENDCKYKDGTLLFGGHKNINTGMVR